MTRSEHLASIHQLGSALLVDGLSVREERRPDWHQAAREESNRVRAEVNAAGDAVLAGPAGDVAKAHRERLAAAEKEAATLGAKLADLEGKIRTASERGDPAMNIRLECKALAGQLAALNEYRAEEKRRLETAEADLEQRTSAAMAAKVQEVFQRVDAELAQARIAMLDALAPHWLKAYCLSGSRVALADLRKRFPQPQTVDGVGSSQAHPSAEYN